MSFLTNPILSPDALGVQVGSSAAVGSVARAWQAYLAVVLTHHGP